jgi:hypothetical protein
VRGVGRVEELALSRGADAHGAGAVLTAPAQLGGDMLQERVAAFDGYRANSGHDRAQLVVG